MLTVMENDYQAALMVPTEILAEPCAQHQTDSRQLALPVELLTGSLKPP